MKTEDKELLKRVLPMYLPYNLKFLHHCGMGTMESINSWCINGEHEDWYVFGEEVIAEEDKFKPLLHPLSRLTEEQLETLQDRELMRQINDADFCVHLLPFQIATLLIEWHYDVFGLIAKGLASPIETNKK